MDLDLKRILRGFSPISAKICGSFFGGFKEPHHVRFSRYTIFSETKNSRPYWYLFILILSNKAGSAGKEIFLPFGYVEVA